MSEENLKNLPPEERIRKLKELEEKKKKEIEEAHKLIKESEEELTERKKWVEKVPIPQVAKEDLRGASREEKEVIKTHRGAKEKAKEEEKAAAAAAEEGAEEENVEKKVRSQKSGTDLESLAREAERLPQEIMNSEYALQLSRQPMRDLYEEITKINQAVEEKGYLNQEEGRRIFYLSSAVERKMEDTAAGKYSFTEEVAQEANLAQKIAAKLRGMYR